MGSVIGPIVLGVFILVLGVFNIKGHISSIHWYHRKRVTEEDRIPFGRTVGSGTVVIGCSLVVFGCLAFVAEKLQNDLFITIGSIAVVAGMVTGLVMGFYAMIKYNKGIF